MSRFPKISVIIPMYSPENFDNVADIIRKLCNVNDLSCESIVVMGVSPAGKARNIGAREATGDILVFVDDDANIVTDNIISKLVSPLISNESIGITGAIQKSPPQMNWIQRAYRMQFPRTEAPDVNVITESDMATTLCCAIRKDDFWRVGGFDERLQAGQDTLLRHKIRQMGKKVVIVPDTLVYHPLPDTLSKVFKREIRYAYGMAQLKKFGLAPVPPSEVKNIWHAIWYILVRILAFPIRFVYGGPDGKSFGFWFLRAPASLVASIAYAYYSVKIERQRH